MSAHHFKKLGVDRRLEGSRLASSPEEIAALKLLLRSKDAVSLIE